MSQKGLRSSTFIPIIGEPGPPWPFAKDCLDNSAAPPRVRSVVPVGEGCALYLSLPDDSSLPSTITMRLKAYATIVDSDYESIRSVDIKYDWFEPTDFTINFSGNQVFTIGKGSAGAVTVKFQFTDAPFVDEPSLLGVEVSIRGYASVSGVEYYFNQPYTLVPA